MTSPKVNNQEQVMSSNTEELRQQLEDIASFKFGPFKNTKPKKLALFPSDSDRHGDGTGVAWSSYDNFISEVITLFEQHESTLKAEYEEKIREARIEENAWSRQQMIVAQALKAPNSGFGRMIKWSINLFNERKLALLTKDTK